MKSTSLPNTKFKTSKLKTVILALSSKLQVALSNNENDSDLEQVIKSSVGLNFYVCFESNGYIYVSKKKIIMLVTFMIKNMPFDIRNRSTCYCTRNGRAE